LFRVLLATLRDCGSLASIAVAELTPASRFAAPSVDPPSTAGFADVLADAQAGSERAWEQLYAQFAKPVRAYVAMRGAVDPDDLVGETFVQIARNLARFEGGEAEFRSWVFMVAHNRVVDERRRVDRRPAVPVPDYDDVASPTGDVESEALDALGLDRVRSMVEGLTPDQRTVLLLRFVGDLTLEEIAVVVGRPLGAVKQLQRRALRSLKRALVAADVPQ
jgi:RNA polymerase sigma-70 factor (ECF subfamily)